MVTINKGVQSHNILTKSVTHRQVRHLPFDAYNWLKQEAKASSGIDKYNCLII